MQKHARRRFGSELFAALMMVPLLAQAVPVGTVIDNTATATFSGGTTSNSNTVTTVTVVARTPSLIEFLQYAPMSPTATPLPVAVTDYSSSGTPAGPFTPMAAPVPAGSTTPINLGSPVPLEPVTVYHQGDPVFLRLTDPDQNLDAFSAETVLVSLNVGATGDMELLRLTETGPDTGVFTGYIQSWISSMYPLAANPANGQLGLQDDVVITADYVDVADGTDTSAASTLVDPFGLVFDSATGGLIDGAQITLINDATGLPATVYGDDGISIFPSTIGSGGTTTDSGGRVYNFGPGEYRFPFVAPGTYRLQVTAPASYSAPSVVPTANLQVLPGAPFAIDAQGSRGLPFAVMLGPAIQIDIPLDPAGVGFFLVKDANRREASAGDFLQYRLTLNNLTGAAATGVEIVDTLPAGLRYQRGSTTLDGNPVPDPVLSADGRSLVFSLNDMPDGTSTEVRYVVEVVLGLRADNVVNRAVANANGNTLLSNEAAVSVNIRQDFLRDRNVLMGRVLADGCAAPGSEAGTGVAGVRIYLENGTWVVSDEQGMFHFEGVRPGSHVVQMDLETLAPHYEPVICEEHSRFAGRAWSRFVDLQGGTLWRTDFHVRSRPPPAVEVGLTFSSSVREHIASYHLALQGGDVPLENMRLLINLPADVRYLPGSSVLDNKTIADPEVRGPVLVYSLGGVPGDWRRELNFIAEVGVGGESAKLPAKAFLMFDGPGKAGQRTPVVETLMQRIVHERAQWEEEGFHFDSFSTHLSSADRQAVKQLAKQLYGHKVIHIEATGHTDNQPIRERSQAQFADNFALSAARAREVGSYLAQQLNLPKSAVTVNGLGATRPYVPNDTAADRARNRRVDLRIVTETVVNAERVSAMQSSANIRVSVAGDWQQSFVMDRKTSSDEVVLATMPTYDRAWADAATPGSQLLWPPADYNPPIASIRIAVQHDPAHSVKLSLNGESISALNFDTRTMNTAGTLLISQWAGVDIERGNNSLVVEIRDSDGKLVERIQRDVRMSSLPVRAELLVEQSRLVADGRQTPVIAVRLYDRDNRPVREGLIGQFMVDPPHVAQQVIDDLQRQPLAGLDRGNPRYRVGKDGIALIELKPTTRTGEATIVIPLAQRDARLRPWLQAAPRDWVLVGLAEGTLAHNAVSGNLETLSAAELENGTFTDSKLSLFARGSVKGEWLLTLAYDSAKDAEERNTLFQEIDPDSYFTVYGDRTVQGYDAASREKLYLRLERRQFYALFGDYTTGLTVTELARYDRSLTGYKSEYRNEHLSLNVFASDSGQNFAKDELRGDGTSGLYQLRFTNLVFNSDKVRIETRDRFRPQVVLSTQTMTRYTDYNIDYAAGTLFFRSPVPGQDAVLNPVFIVVDYETRDSGADEWSYGGRGAARFMDQRAELGVTYINQGKESGDDTLKGVDATVDLTGQTQLKLEYATSQRASAPVRDAYMAELNHSGSTLDGSVYYLEREAGFGIGQQSAIGSGTRLYGVDGRYRMTDRSQLTGQVFRQADLQTDAEQDVIEAAVVHEVGAYGVSAGLRSVRDDYSNGTTNRSNQLTLGAHRSLRDDRLNLRIEHSQSLDENASIDYPTRTIFGADYLLNPSTSLFLEQELTFGDNADTHSTRIGMNVRPWTGATLNTSLEQRGSEYGPRLFANAGLVQTWRVSDAWSVNTSLDSSNTIRDRGATPLSVTLPSASVSSEDFTAVSLGATYQDEDWSWTSRLEHRTAESEDKWGLYSAAAGETRPGLGLSARLQLFETQAMNGKDGTTADLRIGLVHRPFARRWTVLNRTDLSVDRQDGGSSEYDNWKFVNNVLLNYRRASLQASTYYGAKYTHDTIDSADYSAYTDSVGIELRRDLGKRWDVGVRASTLHGWDSHYYDYSWGASVGFNPATNIWLTAGYNRAGYEDDDFNMAGFTAEGPYLKLRFKFDQESVREISSWFNRQ
ncbi:MAG: OmpA family protein [Gammaproteobacteria bacterium]